jgi:uncharacterized protein YdeI (YjbR/CyaY-like superfamily)
MADGRTTEQFAGPEEFRAWLREHHDASSGIWLKIAKSGSDLTTTTYDEALDVALAFGWIDGQKRRGDETYWLQGFTRRRPRSRWSKRNRDKAEALIEAGAMEPSGLAEVERARADGRWDRAYEGQRSARPPADFLSALAQKPAAGEFYATLDSVNRYAILYRIQDATRAETRARRIAEFVGMLERGERLHD